MRQGQSEQKEFHRPVFGIVAITGMDAAAARRHFKFAPGRLVAVSNVCIPNTMAGAMGTKRRFGIGLSLAAMLAAAGEWSAAAAAHPQRREAREPFFSGLGAYARSVSTASRDAQQYFDQGLAFLYGFNQEEAIRSFEAASASDPECAMACWGIAIANGPHINKMEVDRAKAEAAWDAVTRARRLAGGATPVEQALIAALSKRYSDPQPSNRSELDKAYACAMRKVWKQYPADPDVGVLTAEAVMDLHPWDLWTQDAKPKADTPEVLQTLQAVLKISPKHPMALHLLIHALEASSHPERAEAAANLLRDLQPGLGHMVHMPSHIDVRLGRWQQAVVANERAILADKSYRRIVPEPGYYRIYIAHNYHMLAYTAMMQGQSAKATQAAKEMVDGIPRVYRQENPADVDLYSPMPYEVHMRFGRWDQMLAEPEPEREFPVTKAFWHYARGLAYAAKGDIQNAKEEQQRFEASSQRAAAQTPDFGNNETKNVLSIAAKVLEGEILYRHGKATKDPATIDRAIGTLREAAKREECLQYSEPPDWIQPVRHVLGATLMDAGRFAEAETVYRRDLSRNRNNGWSLFGLASSLQKQGKNPQAELARFKAAWQYADVCLSSSCFCLQSTCSVKSRKLR